MNTQIIISRISELCKEKSISINQMLKETNLNKSLVDNLKKGSIPSIDKIEGVADYFNVSIDYILGKSDQKEKPTAIADGEPVKEDVVIFHRDGKTQRKKLSKDQLAMLMAMVDALPESDDED